MEEETVNKTIVILKRQDQWLEKHQGINLSGWIREQLDKLIKQYQ